MSIFRKRTIIAAICIILSAVIAFIALPNIYSNKEATISVLRAAKEIPAGKLIESGDVEMAEIGAYNIHPDALYESGLVVGQYAIVTILPRDLITPAKLSDQQYQSLLEKAIKEEKNLITVTVSTIAAGVGGHLKPGDRVSIYVYTSIYVEGEQIEKVESPALLRNLVLYDLENSKGKSVGSEIISDENIARSATFIVDARQAQALIAAEYGGSIHLVFQSRGEDAP